MKRIIGILALLLAVCVSGSALAAKADFVNTTADSQYHAKHLEEHIGGMDMKCTGNYLKVREQARESAAVLGHLEQKDDFQLLRISGTMAQICVQYAHKTSPDSWEGLTGWVNADYIQCDCTAAEYYGQTPRERSNSFEQYIGTQSVVCTTNNLRVRETPKNGAIVGHIERADRFILRSIKNGWAYIEVTYSDENSRDSWEGLEGWVSLDYLAYNGKKPAATKQPVVTTAWKRAYRSYLETLYYNVQDCKYDLIYVNEDNIPELVINTGVEWGGCLLLTYRNGGVDVLQTNRLHFSYIPGQNLLLNDDGNMGYYHDDIYTIRNGKWVSVASGEYSGEHPEWSDYLGRYVCDDYFWNGKKVSMAQYLNSLNAAYNQKNAAEPECRYNYRGIQNQLKN